MALRCPFLTKLPMNLIKSQPAAVLKFADACPFASANLNLGALKAFSNMSSGGGKIVDQNNNNDKSNITAASTADADAALRREKSSLKPKALGCPGSSTGPTSKPVAAASSSAATAAATAAPARRASNSFHTMSAGPSISSFVPLIKNNDSTSMTPAKSAAAKCPFLKQNQLLEAVAEASEGLQDDVIEIRAQSRDRVDKKDDGVFDYDEYCKDELEKKKREGTYRVFPRVDRKAMQFPYARDRITDSDITVWCSNDYLGMSRHPKVMQAVHDAVDRFGVGAGGTRNIGGNSSLHEALEASLAALHGKERALVFSSCFIANDTCLETLGAKLPGCHIFSDAGNHASMIKGIRNSRAVKHIFRHNDPDHLDQLLSEVDKSVPKIVAFETVHSMTGAVCPLQELIDVAKAHGAITFVDEVHAVGLYGRHGAGIAEREGLMDQVDIFSGTLGKAYGNVGGYIAGSDAVIDLVRSFGSGFIFTTSLPPHVLAGAKESIRILASEEGRVLRRRHQETVNSIRGRLVDEGLPVIHCPSHIIPIHVGDPVLNTKAMYDLRHRWNIYIQAINYPTVKPGEERLRLAPSPFHDRDMTNYFIEAMKDVWKRNSLPFKSMCTISCTYCREPLKFDSLSSREYPCDGSRCRNLRLPDDDPCASNSSRCSSSTSGALSKGSYSRSSG